MFTKIVCLSKFRDPRTTHNPEKEQIPVTVELICNLICNLISYTGINSADFTVGVFLTVCAYIQKSIFRVLTAVNMRNLENRKYFDMRKLSLTLGEPCDRFSDESSK